MKTIRLSSGYQKVLGTYASELARSGVDTTLRGAHTRLLNHLKDISDKAGLASAAGSVAINIGKDVYTALFIRSLSEDVVDSREEMLRSALRGNKNVPPEVLEWLEEVIKETDEQRANFWANVGKQLQEGAVQDTVLPLVELVNTVGPFLSSGWDKVASKFALPIGAAIETAKTLVEIDDFGWMIGKTTAAATLVYVYLPNAPSEAEAPQGLGATQKPTTPESQEAMPFVHGGTLLAWGDNAYRQCNIPSGDDFVQVASGSRNGLALRADGTLAAWGYDEHGECDVPRGSNFTAISSAHWHGLALRKDKSLVAWGQNMPPGNWGNLNVPQGAYNPKTFVGGGAHSIVLRQDGTLLGWGYNYSGQCNVPKGNDYVSVACGGHHSLALKRDGSIVSWGQNDYGQCSNTPGGHYFRAIAGGLYHSVAIKNDGSLVAWGWNAYGQLNVPAGNDFVAVAGGKQHSLALRADGSLAAWGDNSHGQCNVPRGVFTDIAAGEYYSLALTGHRNGQDAGEKRRFQLDGGKDHRNERSSSLLSAKSPSKAEGIVLPEKALTPDVLQMRAYLIYLCYDLYAEAYKGDFVDQGVRWLIGSVQGLVGLVPSWKLDRLKRLEDQRELCAEKYTAAARMLTALATRVTHTRTHDDRDVLGEERNSTVGMSNSAVKPQHEVATPQVLRQTAGSGVLQVRDAIIKFYVRKERLPNSLDEVFPEGVPKDPWGTPYRYKIDDEMGIVYILSDGPDRVSGTADDIKTGASGMAKPHPKLPFTNMLPR